MSSARSPLSISIFLFLFPQRIVIRAASVGLGKGDREDSLSTPGSEMLVTDGGEGAEW